MPFHFPPSYVCPVSLAPSSAIVQNTVSKDTRVKLDVRGVTLAIFCARLALEMRCNITVEAELQPRRIFAHCTNADPADVLSGLSQSLQVSLRKTDAGYEIYRTDEQKTLEAREDRESRARLETTIDAGYQGLSQKLNAASASPKLSFGTFLNGYTPEQRDSMLRMAQQPMGVLYANSHKNLEQRFLYARPFSALSLQEQRDIKSLLGQGGYKFSGLAGPPPDLDHSTIGVVAAFGSLSLGIVGPGSDDLWLDPVNVVSSPSRSAGQHLDHTDDDPFVKEQLRKGELVTGLALAWRNKTVRFKPLDPNRYLPAILHDIEKQTGLVFYGGATLKTEYPVGQMDDIKEDVPLRLGDVLQHLCRAYGPRMRMRTGGMQVTSLTPALDRRLEPSPAIVALLREKNAFDKPTLTLANFTDICALTPAQLLMLPRTGISSKWSYFVTNQLHDHFLATNFYAALSREEREQAARPEGLYLTTLSPALKRQGLLLAESGTTLAAKDETLTLSTFSVTTQQRTVEGGGTALQKVTFTFAGSGGQPRRTIFTF